MTDELKSQAKTQFGQSADDYAVSDIHAQGESLQLLLELIQPQPDWEALDVATGAGHTAHAFARHVRRMVASDFTAQMLAKAAELAAARGLANVETRHADAESLPFADGAFDLVCCRLAFHHFPNPDIALREMARALKPGGMLGFTDNITVEQQHAAEYYNAYEKLRDPSHHRVQSLSELTGAFAAAGLAVRETRKLTKEFEFHNWADRQRVSDANKQRLQQMMKDIPAELEPLFQPRWADGTMYFSLWEAVIVATRSDKDC